MGFCAGDNFCNPCSRMQEKKHLSSVGHSCLTVHWPFLYIQIHCRTTARRSAGAHVPYYSNRPSYSARRCSQCAMVSEPHKSLRKWVRTWSCKQPRPRALQERRLRARQPWPLRPRPSTQRCTMCSTQRTPWGLPRPCLSRGQGIAQPSGRQSSRK